MMVSLFQVIAIKPQNLLILISRYSPNMLCKRVCYDKTIEQFLGNVIKSHMYKIIKITAKIVFYKNEEI